ncbi:MAG: hypothetical protein JHC82_01745 [Stenotrophomonas sp.]|nr:hypothetical protein [Stenotrophomonas sp.]
MKAGWSWLLLVVWLAGCRDREPAPKAVARDICAGRTTVASSSCHVSPTLLLMDDGQLEQRDIAVTLYYPGFGSNIFYAGREAAEAQDLASGFLVEWPQVDAKLRDADGNVRPGYYRLHARFSRIPPLAIGEGVVPPVVVAGRLQAVAQLTAVRTISEIRESCSKTPGCTMEYGEGVYPLPRLDLGVAGGGPGG